MRTIILALAIVTSVMGNEGEVRARAALALSVAVTRRYADKKCPLGVPHCSCGCRDGNTCVCATAKASKRSCGCTTACECGCIYGKQCGCPVIIGVPQGVVGQPVLQPVVQPQPFVNYPVIIPVRDDHIRMPAGSNCPGGK